MREKIEAEEIERGLGAAMPPYKEMMIPEYKVRKLEAENKELRVRLDEVHSWIVCHGIATAEDLMQNSERIEEITRMEKKK